MTLKTTNNRSWEVWTEAGNLIGRIEKRPGEKKLRAFRHDDLVGSVQIGYVDDLFVASALVLTNTVTV